MIEWIMDTVYSFNYRKKFNQRAVSQVLLLRYFHMAQHGELNFSNNIIQLWVAL